MSDNDERTSPREVARLRKAMHRLQNMKDGSASLADREALAVGIEHIEARLIDIRGH